MNRLRDYAGFIGWFAGLGYIVLWPVTGSYSARPLDLPPGLHLLGLLSAVFVAARLLVHAIRRTWNAAGKAAKVQVNPAAVAPPVARKPQPVRRVVKPRKEFGLRGVQR
jgi:hypothetical protein